jgi:trimethylamine--corrinoid protein Co-methyltransferase
VTVTAERIGRRRGTGGPPPPQRQVDYHNLVNPFEPVRIFTDDRIEAIHQTALRVLEELGIKVMLPEARALFSTAGARLDVLRAFIERRSSEGCAPSES